MGATAQPFLIHHHRHAQIFNRIGIGLGEAGQEIAHEHAEVFVQQPLRLSGNRIKNNRRFPRTGDAGKDRDFAFGDAQRDILQIIFARTTDFDIFLLHHSSLMVILLRKVTA